MRMESPLRKTLHHPLVYFLVLVVVSLTAGNPVAGVAAAVVTWFITGLLP